MGRSGAAVMRAHHHHHHQHITPAARRPRFIDVDKQDPTKITVNLPDDGVLPCKGPTWAEEYPFSS